jgi:hypothetical protein
VHPHGEVLALNVAGRNVVDVGTALDAVLLGADALRGAVAPVR